MAFPRGAFPEGKVVARSNQPASRESEAGVLLALAASHSVGSASRGGAERRGPAGRGKEKSLKSLR